MPTFSPFDLLASRPGQQKAALGLSPRESFGARIIPRSIRPFWRVVVAPLFLLHPPVPGQERVWSRDAGNVTETMLDPEPEPDGDPPLSVRQGPACAQLAAEDCILRTEAIVFPGDVVLKQAADFKIAGGEGSLENAMKNKKTGETKTFVYAG